MQRKPIRNGQSKKRVMKIFFVLFLFWILAGSCTKDSGGEISGTVILEQGAGADYYLVEIDNSSTNNYPFICSGDEPYPTAGLYNCKNSVYIKNLPDTLRAIGTKIIFSKYKNFNRNPLWSSTYAPYDVEVYDARKK
ncbi:MAG: hypothetical protein ACKVOW_13820 [Chitinophagaceae bacterium]